MKEEKNYFKDQMQESNTDTGWINYVERYPKECRPASDKLVPAMCKSIFDPWRSHICMVHVNSDGLWFAGSEEFFEISAENILYWFDIEE